MEKAERGKNVKSVAKILDIEKYYYFCNVANINIKTTKLWRIIKI